MSAFRYQAKEASGAPVSGVVEAEDRRAALERLTLQGLFPLSLESCPSPAGNGKPRSAPPPPAPHAPGASALAPRASLLSTEARPRRRVKRKHVTLFTREMATLLQATIPIPQALEGLGLEEENPTLKGVILQLASWVRTGHSLSAAMQAHPGLFPTLYVSVVEAGEEAGALDKVMADLADFLEHEDEVRGEVMSAVAYPLFVLALGVVTTFVLLAFVLPRLFEMLEGMTDILPLPTQILLNVSEFLAAYWPLVLGGVAASILGLRWFLRTPAGALLWDTLKLRLPILGSVLRASALGRFARTLGTLVHSGVSLLPALEIARKTTGNLMVAKAIQEVAEETRGGESLAAPLRRLRLFPATLVQMVAVGEETGRLDAMLLKVASLEERVVRGRSRTLLSLLAPALILFIGSLVGFIVIALLLPIFQMSQALR